MLASDSFEHKQSLLYMFFFHVVSIKTRTDFALLSDSKISGFARPHDSKLFADSKISTLASGFKKLRIRMRIHRKANPERKSCEFKNILIRVDGPKYKDLIELNSYICIG